MTLKEPRSFELTIASRLEEMQAVHALIGEAVREYRLSEEMAHWIELTISESMINAIQHGNKSDPTKEATLRISSNGETIEIIVEDQGKGFEFDSIADPTDIANLLKPSGRGILIIRSFMDEVDLSEREGGGSRLRSGLPDHGRCKRRRLDDVVILDLSGRITIGEGTLILRDRIQKLLKGGDRKFLLNLADVDYIDSSGLGELVSSFTTVRNQEGQLKLLNLTRRVQDLLQITKLLTVFEAFNSEAEALKTMK